jgi:hypothetical protein
MDNNYNDGIAYCGLYCSECPSYTGVIADMARDLRKELRNYRFDKTAELLSSVPIFKTYKKYPDCYTVLGAMVKMRCGKTCKNGGGNPWCKIRQCCKKKEFEGCWECSEFGSCKKLTFLEGNHGKAHVKNLRAIKRKGIQGFIEGTKYWYIKN